MTTSIESSEVKKSKKTPEKSPSRPTNPGGSKPFHFFSLLLFSFSAIAMGVAFYALYTAVQASTLSNDITKKLADSVTKQAGLLANSETSIKNLESNQHHLKNQLSALNRDLQSVAKQPSYQSDEWQLLNARYYLQLAQINAHWNDNLQATMSLLKHADELLSSIHNPQLFDVRQAIAQELSAIQSMPHADITGLLSKLNAMQEAVLNLPMQKSVLAQESASNTTSETPSNNWRNYLKHSLSVLESAIVVRRHDQNVEPLLSAAQEAMLQESIRLSLQQAQWGVLHQNDAVYHMGLQQSLTNIKRAFLTTAPNTTALINQLKTLQSISFQQSKPKIERSLNLLNQVIEQDGANADAKMNRGGQS